MNTNMSQKLPKNSLQDTLPTWSAMFLNEVIMPNYEKKKTDCGSNTIN